MPRTPARAARPRRSGSRAEVRVLGLDGGGSKTLALVADGGGRILGRGEAASSNHHVAGWPQALANLRLAMAGAMKAAGLGGRRNALGAVCLGMAGADTEADNRRLTAWLGRQRLAPRGCVVNDGQLLLAAGAPGRVGLALVAGTGSICWGRADSGRTARAGGWGHVIGDEGSGYWLGLRALQIAAQTADGRARAEALLRALLRRLQLDAPEGLLTYVYGQPRSKTEIAALAPVVFALARRGDAVARGLVDDAADELSRLAVAAGNALGMKRATLVAGGSLLVRQRTLRETVVRRLGARIEQVRVVAEPARGAITLARSLLAPPA